MFSALSRLPVIDVDIDVRGQYLDETGMLQTSDRPIDLHQADAAARHWLPLHADQEYALAVKLRRSQISQKVYSYYFLKRPDGKAFSPMFPKPKDEGWFFILGESDKNDLLALKRIGFVRRDQAIPLAFLTPEDVGRRIYTLYLMSDSYLGLDQQFDLYFDIIESRLEEQISQEIADESCSSL